MSGEPNQFTSHELTRMREKKWFLNFYKRPNWTDKRACWNIGLTKYKKKMTKKDIEIFRATICLVHAIYTIFCYLVEQVH